MLAQMVWGTYLEKNCPSSNGHILVSGGLNACPDGLGHLFTATTVILQFFSNWSQSAQPSPAPECPVEWEGSNRYLGNAQMDCESTNMGLP